jgi:hypothetical protein
MAHKPPSNRTELLNSLRAFAQHTSREWRDVWTIIRAIREDVGPVALFGGALRDWCLTGSKLPPRDFDFVVQTNDISALTDVLREYTISRNNFSGYRIAAGHQVDVWRLADTWAFQNKKTTLDDGFASLVNTTFLNSDAVVYDISGGRVYAHENYLKFLETRELDWNLFPNPNPAGAAIRALRLALVHDFSLSARLVKFIAEQRSNTDDVRLAQLTNSIFHHTVDFDRMLDLLKHVQKRSVKRTERPFKLSSTGHSRTRWHKLLEARSEVDSDAHAIAE